MDDDAAKRYSVSRVLRGAGYAVIEAGTGREALESAPLANLVVLDIRLPDMTGYEVCQVLKNDPKTASIPVLHVSASFTDSESRALGLNLGADGYLVHPIEVNILLATVRSLIRMHRAEAQAVATAAALEQAYREQKRIAEMLQRSLLIKESPNAFSGVKVATFYEAAWEESSVGGDFYDTYQLPDGRIALVVGDATGKGLEAATRTAEVKFALRAFLHEHGDVGVAMGRLNNFICDVVRGNQAESIVAVTIGLVDLDAAEVRFASAGCEPPLILGADKTPRSVETSGVLIGAFPDAAYLTKNAAFNPGDTIILATDGITEARRGRQFLGYEGMVDLASSHLGGDRSVEQEGAALLAAARDFASGKFQDDVCMLLARREP